MFIAKNHAAFAQALDLLPFLKSRFENLKSSKDHATFKRTLKSEVEQKGINAVKALFLMMRESVQPIVETAENMIYFVRYEKLKKETADELAKFLHAYIEDPATSMESCRVAVWVLAKLKRFHDVD